MENKPKASPRQKEIIEEAKRYVDKGFSPMPLGKITKNAAGKKDIVYPHAWKKYQTKRATHEEIESWRCENIGIVTGQVSDLLVLDLDKYKKGYDSELVRSLRLSPTPTSKTAGGGLQSFYKLPKGLVIRNDVCIGHKESGIDIRADGGMVIAPPSKTSYGEYMWEIDPFDNSLAEVPPKLLELLKQGTVSEKKSKKKLTELIGLKEGEGRNNAAASLIGKLLLTTDPSRWDEEVWSMAQQVNRAHKEPMEESELQTVYDSITKTELARRESIFGHKASAKKVSPDRMSPQNILDRLAERGKESIAASKGRLNVYAFIFLIQNPHLKVTPEGQFYDYSSGIYRTLTNLNVRNRISRALVEDDLGDLATPQQVTKIYSLLLANAPTMPESDVDAHLLNVRNGILDLRTMALSPHTHEHISTSQSPASFVPGATCPRFLNFMAEITRDDQELTGYLQEVTGYCALTNDTSHHAAFFIYGTGGNGKGTFVRITSSLVDPQLIFHATVEQVTERFGAWTMIDKRLVILDEPNIKEFKSEIFRRYVSGEPTYAEKKNVAEMIPFKPRARFICTTNEPPRYDEANDANARRFHLIPFNNKFMGEKLVRNLAETIIAEERDGILLWAIEGLRRLQGRGHFSRPEVVQREQKLLRRDNSSVIAFFDENFAIASTEDLCIDLEKNDIYELYVTYCNQNGRVKKSSPQFVRDMKVIENIRCERRDDSITKFTNLLPLEPLKKLQESTEQRTTTGTFKRALGRQWTH